MQEKCKTSCTYSKAGFPKQTIRKCTKCGHPEETLQEYSLRVLKKHFGSSATVRNQENVIKVNSLLLVDNDLEALKGIEGMYKNIEIKRSGSGVVIILNF